MFNKISGYLQSVRTEMGKVTWPARESLIESTGITLLLSIILAIFVFIVDIILSRIINVVI